MFEKIAKQFRKPSGFWGKIVSGLMIKGNRPAYDTLLKDMDVQSGEKILEIGYGPGIGIHLLATAVNCQIYGVDFSELMYKKASKRNKKFIEKSNVKLLYGDFMETLINTEGFDKVFCLNVVYFWENLIPPFIKIKSLLKDGGAFYFYMAKREDLSKLKFTDDSVFNKYTIEEVTEALNTVGFRTVAHHFNLGYFVKAVK
jgi:cyclopropane fatty-acyl-phospholipid synthase-like methyltransferase